MKNVFYLSALTLLFLSCSNNENPKDGLWEDNIKLSQKIANFTAAPDSVTIKTEGDWWWVCYVSLNGLEIDCLKDVNLESEHYVIEQDGFYIERVDKNTLLIKLDENTTSEERVLIVGLEAGDYFDGVRVTQAAK